MNKVIVITGSRKGIGRYLTKYYLNKGFVLIGCDLQETDLNHQSYEHFCLDVADENAVKKMVSGIARKYKQIDYSRQYINCYTHVGVIHLYKWIQILIIFIPNIKLTQNCKQHTYQQVKC